MTESNQWWDRTNEQEPMRTETETQIELKTTWQDNEHMRTWHIKHDMIHNYIYNACMHCTIIYQFLIYNLIRFLTETWPWNFLTGLCWDEVYLIK